METVLRDIRVALRGFRRAPGFPLAAIATLALGIGATTAIFTTLSAVLLHPLPYPHPEQLYSVRTALTDGRVNAGLLSPAEIARLNDPNPSIARAAGYAAGDLTLLADDGTPGHVETYGVTEGFFDLLGLPMTSGSAFTHDDHAPIQPPPPNTTPQPGPTPRVIISARLWKQFFHGDPMIAGKPIHFAGGLNGEIAGVAPRDFDIPHGADVWIAQRNPPNDIGHGFEGLMRLKPGVKIDRANGELQTVMTGLATDFPAADRNRVFVPQPLVDAIVGDLGPILIIVMSATGLLLLIACVSVANLLLARGAVRAREMAVRAALGAGWGRLVRQLLIESMVLATIGTIVGVGIGELGLRALLSIGAAKLPRLDSVPFDGRVLLFSFAVLVITGAIIGLAPAVRLLRNDTKSLMNESSRSSSAGRATTRWLMAMTVAEVALAITLVAGAGWLVRGFAGLRNADPGFLTDKRVVFDAGFTGQHFPNSSALLQTQIDLVNAVRGVRGVTGAGMISAYPMTGRPDRSLVAQFHGESFDATNPPGTRQRSVGPGLFAAMGTRILEGRDFSTSDTQTSIPVAIVNKTFADRYLKGRDPIGMQFSTGYLAPDPRNEITIVGVVEDVRQKSLADRPEPAYYTPMTQYGWERVTVVVSLSQSNPAAAGAVEQGIRAAVQKLHPTMAVDFQSASDIMDATIRRQELGMTLMLVFGFIAIVLAAVGIYGVVSYAGFLRREEMATRLALGATPRSVFLLVMRQGATLGLLGATAGIALAYGAGQVVSSEVYAINTSDPLILAAAALLITMITVLATTIPALRAARVSPMNALQSN